MTYQAISTIDTTPSTIPNIDGVLGRDGVRRQRPRRVRVISRSMSRSRYWLIAFAEPAASVPQIRVQNASRNHSAGAMPGSSRVASTIAGIVVTSRSSMIRGFVSAM